MRLLLDEMWPARVAAQLRDRGHDVVAVAERGDLRGQPDDVVFAAAQAEGRAVVTENVPDFRSLAADALATGRTHAGLVMTTNHAFPRGQSRTLGRLVRSLDSLMNDESSVDGIEVWLT